MDRFGALAMRRAQAIGAGVAAADDDHMLVLRSDRAATDDPILFATAVLRGQVLHREVDALELAAGHGQIARGRGPAGQHDRVEIATELIDRHLDADVRPGPERHPFLAHQREPAIEDAFLELELGNAVAQQPADAIGAFEDGDSMARTVQLICSGEACRTGADDGDLSAGAAGGRPDRDPAFVERAIDDRDLDRLDRHRVGVDPEHARAFARRGTQPARELWKVVRRVKALEGRLPPASIQEIVPIGNQVPQWATLMAEGNPTVHAARRLIAQRRFGIGKIDLAPVVDALRHRSHRRLLADDLDEPGRFTHGRPPRRPARRTPRTGPRPRPAPAPPERACNRAA